MAVCSAMNGPVIIAVASLLQLYISSFNMGTDCSKSQKVPRTVVRKVSCLRRPIVARGTYYGAIDSPAAAAGPPKVSQVV